MIYAHNNEDFSNRHSNALGFAEAKNNHNNSRGEDDTATLSDPGAHC